jgi:hypothetical protein
VRAAFAGNQEAEAASVYVPAPRIAPLGGFFVGEQPTVTLTADDPEAEIRYTLDGSDPVAASLRYEEPFRLAETTVVRARAFHGAAGSDPSEMTYRIVPREQDANVRYDYYEGDWEAVPDFDSMQPLRTGTIYEFHLEGVNRRRDDHYGLKLEGTLPVEQAGEYTFYLTSDDGSRLYVDGEELIDNDGDHGPLTEEGTVRLEPGGHLIRVAYFNAGGGGFLEVQYRGPGVAKQVLSFDRFAAP